MCVITLLTLTFPVFAQTTNATDEYEGTLKKMMKLSGASAATDDLSVSYTHLDVYKRQIIICFCLCIRYLFICFATINTVSYTHLDVYKRQGQYAVEGLRNVKLDNKGIDIQGKPGAQARAIFDGKVAAVFQLNGLFLSLIHI